jgi:ribosomal protein L7/L12
VADTAPKPVVENVSKEDADAAAEKLKAVGAEVEIS